MPRNGGGVYSAPAGTNGVPNTTIESAKYNALVADLVQDANTPRPIVAGGTGEATAVEAGDAFSTKGSNIASAATTNIGAASGRYVVISGTTTITAFDSVPAGVLRILRFAGALTLTHNATSLILPTGANIATAAGDTAFMISEGGGNWTCLVYQRASGESISGSVTVSGRVLLANGTEALPSLAFTGDPNTGFSSGGADTIRASTGGATRLKIDDDGRFLFGDEAYVGAIGDVGTSIQGAGSANPGAISTTVSGFAALFLNRLASNGNIEEFYRQSLLVGSISVTTTATAFNTSSDARLKENFRPFDSGALVDDLQFGMFDWRNGDGVGYGVLAQEAEKVFPQAINVSEDGTYQADYSKFVAIAMAELKSLRARVAELESR